MNRKAKNTVVTSGRLTGAGKVCRLTPRVVPVVRPDPAYSLYSTDSEDQVTSLHTGLDHCAALLNGILQADETASPDFSRTLKTGATKPRSSSSSLGKKSTKKLPFKTASPGLSRVMKGGAAKSRPLTSEGKTTMKKGPTKAVLATNQRSCESGLRGSIRSAAKSQKQPLQRHELKPPHLPDPPPDMTVQLPASLTGQPEHRRVSEHAQYESERGEELVPVRDTNIQPSVEAQPAVSCTLRMSTLQLETGQEETEDKTKTVCGLLGELRTLISGEGSVAERLLSQLEQVVSSQQLNVSGSNGQTDGADGFTSKALQDELSTAQSRLQELQDDLAELRKALQDTQNQLSNAEAENTLLKKDLELTRSRLLESEREKSELASLSQDRLDEMGKLRSFIQTWCSSDRHHVEENTEHLSPDRTGPTADRIHQYLMSLSKAEPAHMEGVSTTAPQPKPVGSEDSRRCWQRFSYTSQCDVESVSYWSMKSGSTFNTRDEAAFRDGLAALDASIASLQKTIQLDLRK